MARDEVRARRLGRRSVEERVARLCAPIDVVRVGSALVGTGLADGRRIGLVATDGTVEQGSFGSSEARAAAALVRRCGSDGLPVVLLFDSSGARLGEGVDGVVANAELLGALAEASGRVPLLAGVFGFAAGSAAYALALCDVALAIGQRSFVFVAGPVVVEAALGSSADVYGLGGTDLHLRTGVLAGEAVEDDDLVARLLALLALLPSSAASLPGRVAAVGPTGILELPADPRATWDGRRAVDAVLDGGSEIPLWTATGGSVLTSLGRVDGQAVALVASQPRVLGGALDANAARKVARFVRFAAAFNLPVVTLCDTPGFLPGADQEAKHVLIDGAAVISAYVEARATVPLVAVVLRRAVGAGTVLVLGAHVLYGLPGAAIVHMGAEAARAAGGTGVDPTSPMRTVEARDLRASVIQALRDAPRPTPAGAGARKTCLVPL